MTSKRPPGFIVILALGLALVLGSGFYQPARAASEDVAMFYDDLSQYGQWVDYENYGPVWRPSNVDDQWRPYTDGRWVPTDDGYVFESQEPWGWATYHYGNWMPTEGYGWVWSPGRTWYPSTVEWRTSPETAQVDNSYVGWAPVPPPDYVPTQSYAASGVLSGGPGGGYARPRRSGSSSGRPASCWVWASRTPRPILTAVAAVWRRRPTCRFSSPRRSSCPAIIRRVITRRLISAGVSPAPIAMGHR